MLSYYACMYENVWNGVIEVCELTCGCWKLNTSIPDSFGRTAYVLNYWYVSSPLLFSFEICNLIIFLCFLSSLPTLTPSHFLQIPRIFEINYMHIYFSLEKTNSYSQLCWIVYRSLCRAEDSWCFPHPAWHLRWCHLGLGDHIGVIILMRVWVLHFMVIKDTLTANFLILRLS